jgi:hypothetical protein
MRFSDSAVKFACGVQFVYAKNLSLWSNHIWNFCSSKCVRPRFLLYPWRIINIQLYHFQANLIYRKHFISYILYKCFPCSLRLHHLSYFWPVSVLEYIIIVQFKCKTLRIKELYIPTTQFRIKTHVNRYWMARNEGGSTLSQILI